MASNNFYRSGLYVKQVVVINSATQLGGTLSSDTLYIIDGAIDMGSISITVPEGGLSISGFSGAREVSCLYSNENDSC